MTAKTADKPTALSALQELLALAAKTRPDIDHRALEGVVLDAIRARGWPWALAQTAGMLARGEYPYDLANAIDPLRSAKGHR